MPAPLFLGETMNGLLILGGANCVWNDLTQVDEVNYDVMAINDMGCMYDGHLRFMVSLHPDKFYQCDPFWAQTRIEKKLNDDFDIISCCAHSDKKRYGITGNLCLDNICGTSGLYAVRVGIHFKYENIVLAGIPLDALHGNIANNNWHISRDLTGEKQAWRRYLPQLKGRVVSLSGWTKRLFDGEKV